MRIINKIYKKIRTSLFFAILAIFLSASRISAVTVNTNFSVPFDSYTYSFWGDPMPAPPVYIPDRVIDFNEYSIGKLVNPSDIFVKDHKIYISDTGNHRVICLNDKWQVILVIDKFTNSGQGDRFNTPSGLFVDETGCIYVADKGNQRIVKLSATGELIGVIGYPVPEVEGVLPENFNYKPKKVVVDIAERVYVLSEGVYEGLLHFDRKGKFLGFIGAPKVRPNMFDYFWKRIATKEQEKRMSLILPTEYNSIDIDERGFIYATVSSGAVLEREAIRRLNPSGGDVLRRSGFFNPVGDVSFPNIYSSASLRGPSVLIDIKVRNYGVYSALDQKRGRVFTYDNNGSLLYVFGYNSDKYGAVSNPAALEILNDQLIILDREKGWVNIYQPTEYVKSIYAAIEYHYKGDYEKATIMWENVLKFNANNDLAYTGMGQAFLRQDNFDAAMENFRLGNNRKEYSEALRLYRREVLADYFGWFVFLMLALMIGGSIFRKRRKQTESDIQEINSISNPFKRKILNIWESLKYSLYIIFHPFKGFWDLKHEKRGNLSAAVIIVALVTFTYIFMRQYTGFIFNPRDLDRLNIITEILSVIIPFILWSIVNWSLTTLMEGKGSLKDVFITSAYALTPIVLINIPITIISNFLIMEEGAFYYFFTTLSFGWFLFLLFFGLMTIHEYDTGKNFFTSVLTICGMLFVIFISILFFNLVEQVGAFAAEIYYELAYRL